MTTTRRHLHLLVGICVASAACQGRTASPDARDNPHVAAILEEAAPTMQDAATATYWGGLGRRITLTDGEWSNGEGPRVHLLRDFYVTADLSGNGATNAVVILEAINAGPESGHYLAVLRHDGMDTISLGTVLLGQAVEIRGLRVDAGRIIVDLTKTGTTPPEPVTLTYLFDRGGLVDVSNQTAPTS